MKFLIPAMQQYFDWNRFWLFLKLEWFRGRLKIAMILDITFGMLFFVGMLLGLAVDTKVSVYDHDGTYTSSLLIGGFIISSLAFRDLGTELRRFRYLTLPVSALERFLGMWLLTAIGWVVIFTFLYTLYAWLSNYLGQMIFSQVTFQSFNPFDGYALNSIKCYLVLQSIFLVGAAHFKGYALPKTLVAITLLAAFTGGTIFLSMKDLFLTDHQCTSAGECELIGALGAHSIWVVLKFFFWWVLAPLSWLATYFGLKGQEV